MMNTHPQPRQNPRGFTLVELIVVIMIIVILIAILIPVVGRVRRAAVAADVKQQITTIADAIHRYHSDFRAYPGPFSNAQIVANTEPTIGAVTLTTASAPGDLDQITMSENLVLALLGGLQITVTGAPPAVTGFEYVPDAVGQGASSLNPAAPRRYPPYLDAVSLSDGLYQDGSVGDWISDSAIPEILDRFPDPMPILYLRAAVGASDVIDVAGAAQYDLRQVLAYTAAYTAADAMDNGAQPVADAKSVGGGKDAPDYYVNSGTALDPRPANPFHGLRNVTVNAVLDPPGSNYYYPYDAFPYFSHPSLPDTPRQKDGFILISAGADRIYGTDDDICNFGSVK